MNRHLKYIDSFLFFYLFILVFNEWLSFLPTMNSRDGAVLSLYTSPISN